MRRRNGTTKQRWRDFLTFFPIINAAWVSLFSLQPVLSIQKYVYLRTPPSSHFSCHVTFLGWQHMTNISSFIWHLLKSKTTSNNILNSRTRLCLALRPQPHTILFESQSQYKLNFLLNLRRGSSFGPGQMVYVDNLPLTTSLASDDDRIAARVYTKPMPKHNETILGYSS